MQAGRPAGGRPPRNHSLLYHTAEKLPRKIAAPGHRARRQRERGRGAAGQPSFMETKLSTMARALSTISGSLPPVPTRLTPCGGPSDQIARGGGATPARFRRRGGETYAPLGAAARGPLGGGSAQLHGDEVVHHGQGVVHHQRVFAAGPHPADAVRGPLRSNCSGRRSHPCAVPPPRRRNLRATGRGGQRAAGRRVSPASWRRSCPPWPGRCPPSAGLFRRPWRTGVCRRRSRRRWRRPA